MGICQGLQVISIIHAQDDINVLDDISIYGKELKVDWNVDIVYKESKMFEQFPNNLWRRMQKEKLVLHAHSFAVSLDNFKSHPSFHKTMKVVQTDTHEKTGKRFINAMESIKYPIFATMYHPEYQLLDFVGSKRWNLKQNNSTDQIAYRFS